MIYYQLRSNNLPIDDILDCVVPFATVQSNIMWAKIESDYCTIL